MKDFIGVALTVSVLLATIAIDLSRLSVLLASVMVVVSVINSAPWVSDEQQRYAIPGFVVLVVLALLPLLMDDYVAVIPAVGGVVGLVTLVVKGPEFRWPAITIFAISVLIGGGIAITTGRHLTGVSLFLLDIVGLVSARYYWQAT